MVRAPAVGWNVGPLRWPWRLLALLGLFTLLVWLAIAWQAQALGPTVVGLVLLLACVGLAARGLWQQPQGLLHWDGSHWHWSEWPQHALLQLHCVLDWQRLLLLRLHGPDGAQRWLWLETPQATPQWLALRRAIVATPAALDTDDAVLDP